MIASAPVTTTPTTAPTPSPPPTAPPPSAPPPSVLHPAAPPPSLPPAPRTAPAPTSTWPLEGTACCAGLFLAPPEGFDLRPRHIFPFGQKKSFSRCLCLF